MTLKEALKPEIVKKEKIAEEKSHVLQLIGKAYIARLVSKEITDQKKVKYLNSLIKNFLSHEEAHRVKGSIHLFDLPSFLMKILM